MLNPKKRLAFPKGRVLVPMAEAELEALIAGRRVARDELIELLHVIQDAKGALPKPLLHALASRLRLSMAEVYEVASFYHHFRIVENDEEIGATQVLRICDSLTCACLGSLALLEEARKTFPENQLRVEAAPCMGRCDKGPVAMLGKKALDEVNIRSLQAAVSKGDSSPDLPAFQRLDAYLKEGGYKSLEALREGRLSPEEVVKTLSDSGLRGMGGAGFPTGLKWSLVLKESRPRLMAVNADEGEPGTFKDRYYLERQPHAFLEGCLIGAEVIEAERVYIYVRDEYPAVRKILMNEIAELEAKGRVDSGFLILRRGAGAYICGEESAMLESIEGKRGLPRHKPPFPTQVGLFGKPTLINNVESLFWVPEILRKGADFWAKAGANGRKGWRSYSVSGRVAEPGVKLAPAGTTLRQLIDEHCGGMAPGHELLAYLPGGASGGILPARLDNLPLDFGTLEQEGCFIGSAAIIVLSDQDDLLEALKNLLLFFKHESCGQCTPCRAGIEKLLDLLERDEINLKAIREIESCMRDASICGLGQAAPNPLASLLRFFPELFGGRLVSENGGEK